MLFISIPQRLLWWRAWHNRNDVIFGKGDVKISHLVGLGKGKIGPEKQEKRGSISGRNYKV
jgi:hypothetical protein